MEFAVKVKGEEMAQWVVAVDPQGERFLLVDAQTNTFQWVPIADCQFERASTPDVPRLVLAVQPQSGPTLVVPSPGLFPKDGGRD